MNYRVAQQYPNSVNNTLTLKLVLGKRAVENCLIGEWEIVLNGTTIRPFTIDGEDAYNEMYAVYNKVVEDLGLTSIDAVTKNLDKY
jgi:hypothetical protein